MRISANALQKAALSAIFSAALYAACIPCVKILGKHVAPAFTGAFLYLGAGLGLMLTMLFKGVSVELALTKKGNPLGRFNGSSGYFSCMCACCRGIINKRGECFASGEL